MYTPLKAQETKAIKEFVQQSISLKQEEDNAKKRKTELVEIEQSCRDFFEQQIGQELCCYPTFTDLQGKMLYLRKSEEVHRLTPTTDRLTTAIMSLNVHAAMKDADLIKAMEDALTTELVVHKSCVTLTPVKARSGITEITNGFPDDWKQQVTKWKQVKEENHDLYLLQQQLKKSKQETIDTYTPLLFPYLETLPTQQHEVEFDSKRLYVGIKQKPTVKSTTVVSLKALKNLLPKIVASVKVSSLSSPNFRSELLACLMEHVALLKQAPSTDTGVVQKQLTLSFKSLRV